MLVSARFLIESCVFVADMIFNHVSASCCHSLHQGHGSRWAAVVTVVPVIPNCVEEDEEEDEEEITLVRETK